MIDYKWLKIHGYETDVEPIEIDEDLKDIVKFLKKELVLDIYKGNKSVGKSIRDSKKFLCSLLKLHNVKSMSTDRLIKRYDDKYANGWSMAMAMNKEIKEINPFRLKKYFINKDNSPLNSSINESLLICDDPEYLIHAPIIFDSITLNTSVPEITGCCYVHEIMHSQLDSIKGSVENYLNSEVISIFMELLTAYNNDPKGQLFSYLVNLRMCELYKSLVLYNSVNEDFDSVNRNEKLIQSKYIVSFLEALNLFDLYQYGNNIERKHIIKSIQRVMDGKRCLEEQLESFEIDFDNSKNIGLLKRFI